MEEEASKGSSGRPKCSGPFRWSHSNFILLVMLDHRLLHTESCLTREAFIMWVPTLTITIKWLERRNNNPIWNEGERNALQLR